MKKNTTLCFNVIICHIGAWWMVGVFRYMAEMMRYLNISKDIAEAAELARLRQAKVRR